MGLIGTTSYFAYLVGEHVGLSGIVVLFCCAVTMSHYAMHNLTKTQRAATMSAFETLSYFSEGSIFVYVGLDALDPAKWKVCESALLTSTPPGMLTVPRAGSSAVIWHRIAGMGLHHPVHL